MLLTKSCYVDISSMDLKKNWPWGISSWQVYCRKYICIQCLTSTHHTHIQSFMHPHTYIMSYSLMSYCANSSLAQVSSFMHPPLHAYHQNATQYTVIKLYRSMQCYIHICMIHSSDIKCKGRMKFLNIYPLSIEYNTQFSDNYLLLFMQKTRVKLLKSSLWVNSLWQTSLACGAREMGVGLKIKMSLFDSHYLPCAEVSGRLLMSCWRCLPSSDKWLVEWKES